ncbi:hypothetical protein BDB00DRAFT_244251 [Zychaea mexicana]|uniref:uncharacterized protein n=1 Tax=Zychaea mexicana TaxID=64656 RepID=UPI0022FE5E60|nr:uncharacterized protein BDB00DRAFT_244251 [Zychaea mexicana]KAI9495354.1 hypothetical protein BDB00DRAFT_244251 [Zychaea mexicana]
MRGNGSTWSRSASSEYKKFSSEQRWLALLAVTIVYGKSLRCFGAAAAAAAAGCFRVNGVSISSSAVLMTMVSGGTTPPTGGDWQTCRSEAQLATIIKKRVSHSCFSLRRQQHPPPTYSLVLTPYQCRVNKSKRSQTDIREPAAWQSSFWRRRVWVAITLEASP